MGGGGYGWDMEIESSEPLQLNYLRATLPSPEAPISYVNVGREGVMWEGSLLAL